MEQNNPLKNQAKIGYANPNSAKNFLEQKVQVTNVVSPSKDINRNDTSSKDSNNQGFFSNLWNKIKSNWVIEEEDYIDAHGFPAKRPKKKIPLLKKKDALNREVNYEGGNALTYASQQSPFGRIFL